MKASPARAIIAEHEAGMHDRRTKDTCKACQKEIQEMAKDKTQCVVCGGSFDGTPSGKAKHDATSKHRDAVAASGVRIPEAPAPTTATVDTSLVARIETLIGEKSRERDNRVRDHAWRVKNRPADADGYHADKVQPLLDEIALLKEAAAALAK